MAAVAAGLMTAAGSANAQECGKDFDADFGSNYTPAGGVGDLAGLIPEEMTGTIGFRGVVSQLPSDIEMVDNGIFTSIRSEVENAITASGHSVEGTFLAPTDYDPVTDELIVVDGMQFSGSGNTYVITGFVSGGPYVATQIQGFPNGGIDKDESTGRFFGADGGGVIKEFFTTQAPVIFYDNMGSSVSDIRVNLGMNEMIFVDSDAGDEIMKVTGLSNQYPHPSAVETPVGLNGPLANYYPNQNGLILTGADNYLQYCDNGGDTTPPSVTNVVNASTDAMNPELVDCNDTEAVVSVAFNEEVVEIDSFVNGQNYVNKTNLVGGDTVEFPNSVSPLNVGVNTYELLVSDASGNEAVVDVFNEIDCPDVEVGAQVPTDGRSFEWSGGVVTAEEGVILTNEGGGVANLSTNSEADAIAEFRALLDRGVVEIGGTGVEVAMPGSQRPEDTTALGIVLGVQGARSAGDTYDVCKADLCVKASTSTDGAEFTDLEGAVHEMVPGETYYVPVSLETDPGTGTGTGTGTGGFDKVDGGGNGAEGCSGCDSNGNPLPTAWFVVGGLALAAGRRRKA